MAGTRERSSTNSTSPFILFITGMSTAGKTTVYESLRNDPQLQPCDFHDIDEGGVPPVGRDPWRAFREEELLHGAIESFNAGRSTILCGIFKPHKIIESKQYDPRYNIHFLLLHIPFEVFEERITSRLKDSQHRHETWDRDSLQDLFVANRALARVLFNSTVNQVNGHVLQTASMSREEMLAATKEVVHHIAVPVV